jgi:hypothetical protein
VVAIRTAITEGIVADPSAPSSNDADSPVGPVAALVNNFDGVPREVIDRVPRMSPAPELVA